MKSIMKKTILFLASVGILLTSMFSNITVPVLADGEKTVFEVNKANEVIEEAKKHLGKPYVWGAAGPDSFDCSGFVSYVLKQVGISIGVERFGTETAESIFRQNGITCYTYSTNTSMPEHAYPGDFVFWCGEDGVSQHMGIYLGGGKVIHCAAAMPTPPKNQVIISDIDALGQKHGTTLVSYRVWRVFPQSGGLMLKKIGEDFEPLAGAVFEITLPDGSIRTVTTNSEGIWDSESAGVDLEAGTYYVEEISAPYGHILVPGKREIPVRAGQKSSENLSIFQNKKPTGCITLTKYNSDKSATIPGTNYRVTSDTGFEQNVSTDSEGKVYLTGLLLGTYTFTETSAADFYLLNEEPIVVTLSYQDQYTSIITAEVEQTNEEPTAIIYSMKQDVETGTAQGDAVLRGAEYQLIAAEDIYNVARTKKFYSQGEIVATRITDEQGRMEEIQNLPMGHYQLKEVSPSEGYLLDPNVYDIYCTYEGHDHPIVIREQVSHEQVKKQAFQIMKISSEGSGESVLLEGAEFTVKLASEVNRVGWEQAKTYDTLVSDATGYARSIELPYGTYIVRETKIPENVLPVADFRVVINEDSREPQIWRVLNDAPFKALIKMVKVDKETGKTVLLPNTSFKIKNLTTNEYVGQWAWFPVPHFIDVFSTDETGSVMTSEPLDVGEYQLEEIKSPEGYILDQTPIKFIVNTQTAFQMAEDGTTPVITVEKENQPVKGKITVSKIGEQLVGTTEDEQGNIQFIYESLPVEGAEFIIEANEAIYSTDHQQSLIYHQGEIVEEIKTVNGYAESSPLPLGKYRVYEKIAGETFVLDQEVKKIELTYQGENIPLVFENIEIENQRQKVELTVKKMDKEDSALLSGAEFGLYAKEEIFGKNQSVVLVEAGSLIEIVNTDETGTAQFLADLPINAQFEIKELTAPMGYVSTDEILTVDTSYQGQDQKVISLEPVFKNEITKIEVSKKDSTNNEEISGASLIVYSKEDEDQVVDRWISGQDGYNEDGTILPHMIKGLEVGKTYIFKEISAPYGYAIAQEIEFTVEDTGEVQVVEMKDEPVFGQLKWKKSGEIFTQSVTGQTEFGMTESPVWEISNISGAEITIYAAEEIIVANHTVYHADEIVEVLESGEDFVTSKKLPVGRYYYLETKTPFGYIQDTTKHYFEIEDNRINELQEITSILENKRPTFDLELTKVLEEQKIFKNPNAYKDIVFGIFAREDIMNDRGNVVIEQGMMIYTSGINEDGKLTLAELFDLPDGKYYLKELATNPQYVLSDKQYDFEISYHGEAVSHIRVMIGEEGNVNNELARGMIQVKKVDSTDENKILTKVEFKLSTQKEMSEIIMTAKTDDKGIATFDELELGTYYIQESRQAEGYVLNDHIYQVEITKDGDMFTITCENKPTEMLFSKQDLSTGQELAGAMMEVREKETQLVIDRWESTETPHLIQYLVEGKEYILCEILAPKGYSIAEEIPFTAKDGMKVVMKDQLEPDTPNTGDQSHLYFWIALLLVSGSVLVFGLNKKRNEKQEGVKGE